MLFIGNSLTFFNEMPDSLRSIAESKGKELHVDYTLTRNGANLRDFWDKGEALELIQSIEWDYVVLQGHSKAALENKDEFRNYVQLFDKEIRANNSRTILYITNTRAEKGKVVTQQQSTHNQVYLDIAKEIDAIIAPVGQAWLAVSDKHPDVKIYSNDNLHPSRLGSYLIAAVFYGVLFDESPENATDKMLISEEKEKAAILQNTAWEIVGNIK